MQQTKMTLQELIDTAEARLADLNYSQKAIYLQVQQQLASRAKCHLFRRQ